VGCGHEAGAMAGSEGSKGSVPPLDFDAHNPERAYRIPQPTAAAKCEELMKLLITSFRFIF
jgi:hypothetical protein